jgi:hypothetical protein
MIFVNGYKDVAYNQAYNVFGSLWPNETEVHKSIDLLC